MSGLNLIPNPTIYRDSSVVFLTAYVIVKKFYVTPMQRYVQKRLAATTGSKDAATNTTCTANALLDNRLRKDDASAQSNTFYRGTS